MNPLKRRRLNYKRNKLSRKKCLADTTKRQRERETHWVIQATAETDNPAFTRLGSTAQPFAPLIAHVNDVTRKKSHLGEIKHQRGRKGPKAEKTLTATARMHENMTRFNRIEITYANIAPLRVGDGLRGHGSREKRCSGRRSVNELLPTLNFHPLRTIATDTNDPVLSSSCLVGE